MSRLSIEQRMEVMRLAVSLESSVTSKRLVENAEAIAAFVSGMVTLPATQPAANEGESDDSAED